MFILNLFVDTFKNFIKNIIGVQSMKKIYSYISFYWLNINHGEVQSEFTSNYLLLIN